MSRERTKHYLLWWRENGAQEWNEQMLPKVLLGHSGGRLFGRSTKEKGREGEVDEVSGERRIRSQIGHKKWL